MRRQTAAAIQALREEARPRFVRYAREVALPRLGAGSSEPKLVAPALGLGSLLFFVEACGVPPLVLRAESGRRLGRRAKGHETLLELGLNVPQVLHLDRGVGTRLRYGDNFMVEERLPGEPFQKESDAAAAGEVGRVFAVLHGKVGGSVGHVAAIHWPWDRLKRKLRRSTRGHLRRFALKRGPEAVEIIRWVEAQPEALWDHTARLGLGDVSANNVLVHEGRLGLIDLSGVCYGSAPLEVVRLRHKLLGSDEALFSAFWSGYQKAATPALRKEVETALPLFEVLHHLRQYGRHVSHRPDAAAIDLERLAAAFAAVR